MITPKGNRLVLFGVTAAAIAIGVATAASCGTLVVVPVGVSRAALRSESLTVSRKNQHADDCKCHNAHYIPPFGKFQSRRSVPPNKASLLRRWLPERDLQWLYDTVAQCQGHKDFGLTPPAASVSGGLASGTNDRDRVPSRRPRSRRSASSRPILPSSR
jgi:hypothetical protein